MYRYPRAFPLSTNERGHAEPPKMQQSEYTITYGRPVIHRVWYNADGQRHRTTGPAVEVWTVLPGGAHVLWYQAWYVNGRIHREGRPAAREWQVANNGARALVWEEWARHGHRVDGPSTRCWTVGPDGTRTLADEEWRVNDRRHRVDGPVLGRHCFYWHDKAVKSEDLPWLRRGHGLLTAFTGATQQGGGSGVSPAWSRDARVAMTEVGSASGTPSTYRSAVGGTVLLCV